MNFYVVVTVLMLFIFILKIKSKKIAYFLLFLLFFLAAFRGENVGTDTANYLSYSNLANRAENANFDNFNILDLGSRIEVVNNYACKLIIQFKLNPRTILIFYDAIMLVFLAMACKRFKVNIIYVAFFYILFGYYFVSFNIARQLCAASVVLYALSFLKELGKKRLLFFLWLIFAIGIHSLSIICSVFYIVTVLPKLKTKYVFFILAFSLALIFIHVDFINQIFNVASSSHIDFYMNQFGDMREFNAVGIISCSIEVLCFYYFFFRTKTLYRSEELNVYDYIYLLSIFFYTAFFNYNGIVSRMRFTLCIYICIYLANFFIVKPLKINSKDGLIFIMLFLLNLIKRYQYSLGEDVAYSITF